MRLIIISALSFFLINANAQSNILKVKGKVISENGMPVAFVNIGIVNKNIGTVSNAQGLFAIDISGFYAKERIMFSCIGYETNEYVLDSLISLIDKNSGVIKMKEKILVLKEVVVKTKKTKIVLEGSRTESTRLTAGFPSYKYLGSEIGIGVNVKARENTIVSLEEFSFFVASSVPDDTVIMRLNIYKLDKKKLPDVPMLRDRVILSVPNRRGWVKTDLTAYKLYTESDFVITLEWIDYNLKNSKIRFSSSFPYTGKIYFRLASQGKWWTPRGGPIGFNVKLSYYPKI
jgi:hypothetical protein